MTTLAKAEHFAGPPQWTWYILFYFFLAGLSGGSYVVATLLRLRGDPAQRAAARLGYYVAFLAFVVCPVLLTLDLGQPQRFWHMLVNTTPGQEAASFKYWSPMSVGAWALVVYGVFVTVSVIGAFVGDRAARTGTSGGLARLFDGAAGGAWAVLGSLVGLFIAGYTGVLLAVSNQPVWSDTWALGGLFLASGFSGSAALLGWLVRFRAQARTAAEPVANAERFFVLLELLLIAAFVATLIPAGTLGHAFRYPWALLWVVAIAGLLPALFRREPRPTGTDGAGTVAGTAAARAVAAPGLLVTLVVLIGVLALRAAVIFSGQ
jgi:formate-dependent nitrite reductase membrane component NrfD